LVNPYTDIDAADVPHPAAASDFRADYNGHATNCNAASCGKSLIFLAFRARQLATAATAR